QQPVPQPAAAEPQCLERKVEGLTGHLPEVRVAALQRPQPRILELLLTPKRAQGARLLTQLGAAGPRGCSDVEQSAVRIEHAGANAVQRSETHDPGRLIWPDLSSGTTH